MVCRLTRNVLLLLGLSSALVTGCIFSPERKPATKIVEAGYPLAPTSPSNVLRNLVGAYVRRDSIETELVYDENYTGTSNAPGEPQSTFKRTDEVRHVGALKLSTNIVGVYLDLGEYQIWQRRPGNAGDPAGYAIINIPASKVAIDDVGSGTYWESLDRFLEYTFKPTVHAPGDTTWTVIGWTEVAN
jgi:hypothetical protein